MRKVPTWVIVTISLIICAIVASIPLGARLAHARRETDLTDEEIAEYDDYTIAVPEGTGITEFVLSISQFDCASTAPDERQIRYYTSDELPKYLYNCAEIEEICVDREYLIIRYITPAGDSVGFTCQEDTYASRTFGETETGTVVQIVPTEQGYWGGQEQLPCAGKRLADHLAPQGLCVDAAVFRLRCQGEWASIDLTNYSRNIKNSGNRKNRLHLSRKYNILDALTERS